VEQLQANGTVGMWEGEEREATTRGDMMGRRQGEGVYWSGGGWRVRN